ncbi:MAG: choice-of-anchor B family protein [Bacteroidota bacterium]
MKHCYFLLALLGMSLSVLAQNQNLNLRSNLTYSQDLNDIWGYADGQGNEYAIVGAANGVSLVNVTDPDNINEISFFPGDNSVWRDMKTYAGYAYITTDQGNDGIMVIDLTNLPNSVSATFWAPNLTINGVSGTLRTAHNIYIDENGYAYISGANLNSGGILILDVFTTPGTPIFVNAVDNQYSHDSYARGDTLWTSDIDDGELRIIDVTDKMNPVVMATQSTPFFFTHNAWMSDDNTVVYTTDEIGNAPVAAYDVSDLTDIQLLDEFRPLATVGEGVVPHNVHVLNDFLVISYYTDGLIVVDANEPDNLVEVGSYDTFAGPSGGTNGCWGAYPFLPSGNILATDIDNGLFVFTPNYIRASYLTGFVTDASNSNPVFGANVEIFGTNVIEATELNGSYQTGAALNGSVDILFSAPGYEDQLLTVDLVEGVTTVLNAQLTPLVPFTVTGSFFDLVSANPIDGGVILFEGEDFTYETTTDASGAFTIPNFFEGEYDVFAGKWGFQTIEVGAQSFSQASTTISLETEVGIVDPFALDLGWVVSGLVADGDWERDVPIAVPTPLGFSITPSADVPNDVGDKCWVTGNGSDIFDDNVNLGTTTLTSPEFDLTNITNPQISYNYWFVSGNPNTFGAGNDSLFVFLNNGSEEVRIAGYSTSNLFATLQWESDQIQVIDFITPTSTMTISFETSDFIQQDDITEAGVDNFVVFAGDPVSVEAPSIGLNKLDAFPNPSATGFTVQVDLDQLESNTQVRVWNSTGQLVDQQEIGQVREQFQIGQQWPAGVYFLRLESPSGASESLKLIKTDGIR